MKDVLYCWRDTSHKVWISHNDGAGHKEILHTDISRQAMKDYAINHIEEFAENTISFWRPNTDRQYYISDVVFSYMAKLG